MTEDDIRKIESSLSLRLPQQYRDAVCPFPVKAYIGNCDTDLWDDADKLIALNQRLHSCESWPENLFAVGEDAGGTETAIDLTTPDSQVWWIDRHIKAPGTGPIRQTFVQWSSELIRQMRTGEYWDGFDPENDPPGTRGKKGPVTNLEPLGCIFALFWLSVVGTLIIVGIQKLFGWE